MSELQEEPPISNARLSEGLRRPHLDIISMVTQGIISSPSPSQLRAPRQCCLSQTDLQETTAFPSFPKAFLQG